MYDFIYKTIYFTKMLCDGDGRKTPKYKAKNE